MEKIYFKEATVMPKQGLIKFFVNISQQTGDFNIMHGENIKMTGKIRTPENIENELAQLPDVIKTQEFTLDQSDIYKIFVLRGYEYDGHFKTILTANPQFTLGEVQWMNNYVPFLDTLLQFTIYSPDTTHLYLISKMDKITIDPLLHKRIVENIPEGKGVPVSRYPQLGIIKSGGVEIKGTKSVYAPRKQNQANLLLEKHIFVPYENNRPLDSDPNKAKLNALTVFMQIINENLDASRIKAVEIAENRPINTLLAPLVSDIIRNGNMLAVSITNENRNSIKIKTSSIFITG